MKNIDLKYTISRSFSRKINLGNFENIDLWASHSQEVPVETSLEEKKKISEGLFTSARLEVEDALIEFRKAKELKIEQKAEAELNLGLSFQEEEDRSQEEKLKEANEKLGLK